jgi:hypothetical protein
VLFTAELRMPISVAKLHDAIIPAHRSEPPGG